MPKYKTLSPQQDAGWGLIYRLNELWANVERYAPKGEYDSWNFKLDRIWCNLLYRNPMEIIRDKNNKIIDIKLSNEDLEEKNFLDSKIFKAKFAMAEQVDDEGKIKIKKEYWKRQKEYYDALTIKEIWLKKFMHSLGLYLKEFEWDPAKAIYGGFKSM